MFHHYWALRSSDWIHTKPAHKFSCVFFEQGRAVAPNVLLEGTMDTPGKMILRSSVERAMNLSSPILIWNIKIENLFKELHFLIINIMMEPGNSCRFTRNAHYLKRLKEDTGKLRNWFLLLSGKNRWRRIHTENPVSP